MPSILHEALVTLFRNRPSLAPELVDDEVGLFYTDLVMAALSEAARTALEAIMSTGTYEYQSDFARKYFGRGKAEGKASSVLTVLEARGFEVPSEVREAVLACRDESRLDRLLSLAVKVASADELLHS